MDKAIRICIVIFSFFIIFGLFYYFMIYIPNIQLQRETQIRLEIESKERTAREERLHEIYMEATQRQDKIEAEQQIRIKQEKLQKDEAQTKNEEQQALQQASYKECISIIYQNYNSQWSKACLDHANDNSIKLHECLADQTFERVICQELYGKIDSSPSCSLPPSIADSIENNRREGEERCLKSVQTGF